MKKVLVTGASGFVGSSLLDILLKKGYSVTVLARRESSLDFFKGREKLFPSLLSIEIVDWSSPTEELGRIVCEANYIVHCAAVLTALTYSDYYNANVLPVKVLIEQAKKSVRLKHFIYISSQAAAGPAVREDLPKTELDDASPISSYGETKRLAEKELYRVRSLFRISVLRPCSIYGPRDFEFHPLFKLVSYGLSVLVAGGRNKVNLIYIKDFIKIILGLMNTDYKEKGKERFAIYFATDGNVYDWSAIYGSVKGIMNKKTLSIGLPSFLVRIIGYINDFIARLSRKPALLNSDKAEEMLCEFWLCSPEKLEKEINFKASYDLRKGFNETYRWYKENSYL